jgi:hypothetical protein
VTVVLVEGDEFPATGEAAAGEAGRGWSQWRWLLAGLLLGMAATFGAMRWVESRRQTEPPLTPQVLAVGPSQRFESISAALMQARRGDTVEVVPGEYREQVLLRGGVTVRSQTPRQAILLPVPLSDGPLIVADHIQDARVSGFVIRGGGETPISAAIVLTESNVEVSEVEVTGAGMGVVIRGGSPRLVGNSFHECTGGGVLVEGAATPWLLHNSIRRNGGAGLEARESARPAVLGNVFETNTVRLPSEIPMSTVRAQNVFLETPGARR